MKKVTILTVLSLLISLVTYHVSYASQDQSKLDCMKKVELNMAQFQHEVMEEVFTSFDIPFEMKHRINHITFHDLSKFQYLHPEQEKDIESLTPFLTGTSIGEKRVYFLGGDPNLGTIFFKDLEGNNHMKTIKRADNGWIEISNKVTDGTKMEYKKLKCEEEYHIQQFLNDLFKKKD
jgi:hypothetical protein